MKKVSRKEFLEGALAWIGGGALLLGQAACGDDSGGTSDAGAADGAGAADAAAGAADGAGSKDAGGAADAGGRSKDARSSTDSRRSRDAAAGVDARSPAPDSRSRTDSSSPSRCLTNGTNVAISRNHGHQMSVSKADVQAGAAKTYHIQGTSQHDHTVTLTAADFAKLRQGAKAIEVSSKTLGHTHTITVTCA